MGGVMLIASMAKVPIVPAYIVKRKHFWQRHRLIFGEPMVVSDYVSKALPGKKDMEQLLAVYDERCRLCREYADSI